MPRGDGSSKQERKEVAAAVRKMIETKKVGEVSDVHLNDLRSRKGFTQRRQGKTHTRRVVDGMLTLRASKVVVSVRKRSLMCRANIGVEGETLHYNR